MIKTDSFNNLAPEASGEKPLGIHSKKSPPLKNYLQFANQYYVLANSVLADHETRVLKQGETFAIFDPYGDVIPVTHPEAGVFYGGTRYLSRFELYVCNGQRPLLLNSTLRDDSGVLKVEMTNSDFDLEGSGFLPKGSLHIQREKFLLNGEHYERVRIENFSHHDLELDAEIIVEADFADIFEVRGSKRARRGQLAKPVMKSDGFVLSYVGLDDVKRTNQVTVVGATCEVGESTLRVPLNIVSKGKLEFVIQMRFSHEEVNQKPPLKKDSDRSRSQNQSQDQSQDKSQDKSQDQSQNQSQHKSGGDLFECCMRQVKRDHEQGKSRFCDVKTSNEQFESWMQRTTDDLVMMTTQTPEGHLYPYAGIPWFCAAFGRDGIITALQCLWANPELAAGVLRLLADTQAKETSPAQDATPGKIIHEVRFGEMATLKEIPFGKYYGSIDSTPLFVCLAGCYYERTGDAELIREIWNELSLSILWIDAYGDRDGDGFIEYQRENANGLVQQGWKDSHDSIFHENGEDAIGPIALAEVQAYCYMAFEKASVLANVVGQYELVAKYSERAARLKKSFNEKFWLEDLGTYAIALDGKKNPCRVQSSNAGQCLFTGIVPIERAEQLVKTLMSPESFSGWGIRTVATTAARYNPMSYHNGSVWPHDTSLVAYGMAVMGFKREAEAIFEGLFKSATYISLYRMPEVYCGFERREGESPTLYPNACSPQAWAAGSLYMILGALLGLEVNALTRQVRFCRPRIPASLEQVKLLGLRIGDANLDLIVQNYHSDESRDVSVQILERVGRISVTVEK